MASEFHKKEICERFYLAFFVQVVDLTLVDMLVVRATDYNP